MTDLANLRGPTHGGPMDTQRHTRAARQGDTVEPNSELARLRDRWQQAAAQRTQLIPNDPIATVFDLCAAELEATLTRQFAKPWSPTEYAQAHGVTPQAVTQWCRKGSIEAYRDHDGGQWRIPRTATRRVTP